MKSFIKILFICFLLVNVGKNDIKAQGPEVSFQFFFDNLSPYGYWSLHPDYGYVWIPDASPDFVPYFTDGHWVFTNYGWTWVSFFDWGWAPFHYGRWDWDDMYGWFWVPGSEWAPAWVVWRKAHGYYGWAPMSPGVSINVNFGYYRDRPERWIFVHDRDFVRSDFQRYHVSRANNITIINNSTVINNTYVDNRSNTTYFAGPRREEVQRTSGRRINALRVQDNIRPGTNVEKDRVEIYRPSVRRTSNTQEKPSPNNVLDAQEVRRRRSSNSTAPLNSPMQQSGEPANSDRRGRESGYGTPSNRNKDYQGETPSNRRAGGQEMPNREEYRQQRSEPSQPQQQVPSDRRKSSETPRQTVPSQNSTRAKEQSRPEQTQPQQPSPAQSGRRQGATQQSQPSVTPQAQPNQPNSAPSSQRRQNAQPQSPPAENKQGGNSNSQQGGRRR